MQLLKLNGKFLAGIIISDLSDPNNGMFKEKKN